MVFLNNNKMLSTIVLGISCLSYSTTNALSIAYIGDTGAGPDALANLNIMKSQGVDLLIHNGDFDYESDPELWDEFIATNWDRDVLVSSGNHESDWWSTSQSGGMKWHGDNGYKKRLYQYAASSDRKYPLSTHCKARTGSTLEESYGEYYSCEHENVLHVFIGWEQLSGDLFYPITNHEDSLEYLESILSNSDATFRVCSWHRPEGKLQASNDHSKNYKTQKVYEMCRKYGAMVISGHTHLYSRTKLVSSFQPVEVSDLHVPNQLNLDCGHSASVVTGMGGKSTEKRGRYADNPYFESAYSEADGDATHGVLVCHYGNTTATCDYLISSGAVYDEFNVTAPRPAAICKDAVTLADIDPFSDPDYDGVMAPELQMSLMIAGFVAVLLLIATLLITGIVKGVRRVRRSRKTAYSED